MTATDELRALLDERGVEHFDNNERTLWGCGDYYPYSAVENFGGSLNVHTHAYDLTPAQAIAATLGAGTCHLVKEHVGRSGKAYRMVCSKCHHVIYDGWQEKPRYCAFCGARVEDE